MPATTSLPTRIERVSSARHRWVAPGDRCFFLHRYYGPLYSTLQDFKQRRGQSLRTQHAASSRIATLLRHATQPLLAGADLVIPMPSSRAGAYPRLRHCVEAAWPAPPVVPLLGVRDGGYDTFHHHRAHQRPGPDYLTARLYVDPRIPRPAGNRALLVDDVLTTGAHWHAARTLLERAGFAVTGLFFTAATRCRLSSRDRRSTRSHSSTV